MYTPLAFLTGKISPVYGTTHFYITTTTHHPPRFLIDHVWRFSILIQSIFVLFETNQSSERIVRLGAHNKSEWPHLRLNSYWNRHSPRVSRFWQLSDNEVGVFFLFLWPAIARSFSSPFGQPWLAFCALRFGLVTQSSCSLGFVIKAYIIFFTDVPIIGCTSLSSPAAFGIGDHVY